MVRWVHEDTNINMRNFTFEVDGRKTLAKIHTMDLNDFKCYEEFEIIPYTLNDIMVGRIDINGRFLIPVAESYTHIMNYTTPDNDDALRIIVYRPNTLVKIYEGTKESNKPLKTSS
jgi:hypothetical protein